MAEEKTLNPDSVSLEDITRMGPREFRQWTFLRLNSIDEKLKGHDSRFDKLDSRLFWILGSAVLLGVVAILAAVL